MIHYVYRVIQDFGDHQEFYWNVNGDLWGVRMGRVSASLTVEGSLAPALTGASACYYGEYGAVNRCGITRSDLAGGNVRFATSGVGVAANQTQTLAVGFVAGTVAPPPMAENVRTSLILGWGLAGGLALAVLVALVSAATRGRRAMGLDPGVVQFAPDDDLPPIVAAALVGAPGRGLLAELMRAASEGHVRLTGGGGTPEPLTATLVSWPDEWQESSQTALATIFPGRGPDTRVDVRAALDDIGYRTTHDLLDLAPRLGLIDFPDVRSWSVGLIWATALVPSLIVGTGLGNAVPAPWWLPAAGLAIVSLAVGYGLLMRWQSLTDEGKRAYRFLNGLRLFLATSEAARMRAVQGAETSERRGSENLVPIFEKLLPYAIALGVEDSWQQAVGTDLEPDIRFDWLPTGTGITWERLGWTSEPYSSDLRRYSYYDHTSRGTMGSVLGDWGTAFGDGVGDFLRSASTGSGGGRSGWSSGGGGWSGGGSHGGGFSGGGGGGGGGSW